MEFLDDFKPVEPIKRTKEILQRTVAWGAGVLAAGTTTELCLSEHIRGSDGGNEHTV